MTIAESVRFVKPAWVAERWSVSPRQVYRLIEVGQLPSVVIGERSVRVPIDAVEAYELEHLRGA